MLSVLLSLTNIGIGIHYYTMRSAETFRINSPERGMYLVLVESESVPEITGSYNVVELPGMLTLQDGTRVKAAYIVTQAGYPRFRLYAWGRVKITVLHDPEPIVKRFSGVRFFSRYIPAGTIGFFNVIGECVMGAKLVAPNGAVIASQYGMPIIVLEYTALLSGYYKVIVYSQYRCPVIVANFEEN